jgi:hypothetical protein
MMVTEWFTETLDSCFELIQLVAREDFIEIYIKTSTCKHLPDAFAALLCHFVRHKSYVNCLGLKLDLHSEMPAPSHLSHVTAISLLYTYCCNYQCGT